MTGGVIAICLAMLAVTARRDIASFDIYWHLQTGMDWLKYGLSPWIDHYSFTLQGERISAQPVFFQVTTAWLVEQFGIEPGLQIFKFAGFVSVLALTLFLLKKLRSPALIYMVILPLIVVLIQARAFTRPELLSYSFSVLAVILYHRAKGRITLNTVLPMVLLMLLWSNYHNSILGYIIFFGFFVGTAISQIREKAGLGEWSRWAAWGLAIVGVGFLNHSFTHSIISSLMMAPEWKDFIQEYESSLNLYRDNLTMYGLLFITALTLMLAFANRSYGLLIITAVLLINALQVSRLVTPSGIIVLCIFAIQVSKAQINGTLARITRPVSILLNIALLLIFTIAMFYGVVLSRAFMEENKSSINKYPFSMVMYMKDQGMKGHIFNEYGVGGYLIYHLSPDSKVYIDGRTDILYQPEHFARFLKVRNSPSEFALEMEQYGFDYVVLETDPLAFSAMHNTGIFTLDFADARHALFVRENANFPVSGKLLGYPACWNQDLTEDLEAELEKAIWTLSGNSFLLPYLQFATTYSQTEDKEAFFLKLHESPPYDIHSSRFAAYQALSHGHDELGRKLLAQFTAWDLGDFIAAAIASMRIKDWAKAEQYLDDATKIPWPNVTPGQTILLFRTLQSLNQQAPLKLIDEEYLDKLRNNMTNMGESLDNLELEFELFCNP